MNEQLIYQVYVGKRNLLYDKCTATVKAYCERHDIDYIQQVEPTLRITPDPLTNGRSPQATDRLGYLPIFEKENALELLGAEYDQVAVIDADIWIRDTAPNIFDEIAGGGVDFAGVVERDAPIKPTYATKLQGYARGQYGNPNFPFMNMGVMLMNQSLREFCPESPEEFIRRSEFKAFVDGSGNYKWSTDQTLLNTWLHKSHARVKFMDWRWNALYGALQPGKVDEAYFVHFFLKDHLTSNDPEILLKSAGRPRV